MELGEAGLRVKAVGFESQQNARVILVPESVAVDEDKSLRRAALAGLVALLLGFSLTPRFSVAPPTARCWC